MPRLICLLPCENLIISNENKVSLISLLESINIALPSSQAIPPGSVVPMRWWAVTIWEREASDENREFETYVDIGTVKTQIAKFRVTTPMYRALHMIQGFPLAVGQNLLRAYLKDTTQTNFTEVGKYPITVQVSPTGGPTN